MESPGNSQGGATDGVWQGADLVVSVLHSRAAVATQVLLTSRRSGASVLVDAGDGCLRDLMERRFDFGDLKGILLTHAHYDHCGGLFSLLSFLTVLCRRSEKLRVFTPAICDEAAGQIQLWRDVFASRETYDVEHRFVSPGERWRVADFTFAALQAAHPSSETTSRECDGVVSAPPASESGLAYLVRIGREKAVVCLDSGPTDRLRGHVRGADLALLEATLSSSNRRLSQIHMTEAEARAMGRGAACCLLVHRGIHGEYFSRLTNPGS